MHVLIVCTYRYNSMIVNHWAGVPVPPKKTPTVNAKDPFWPAALRSALAAVILNFVRPECPIPDLNQCRLGPLFLQCEHAVACGGLTIEAIVSCCSGSKTGWARPSWLAILQSLCRKPTHVMLATEPMPQFALVVARDVYFFFVLPSRYFLNLDRW